MHYAILIGYNQFHFWSHWSAIERIETRVSTIYWSLLILKAIIKGNRFWWSPFELNIIMNMRAAHTNWSDKQAFSVFSFVIFPLIYGLFFLLISATNCMPFVTGDVSSCAWWTSFCKCGWWTDSLMVNFCPMDGV